MFSYLQIHIYFHTVLLKNEYQIHSYTTSNMDDFKTICVYEYLTISAYFFERQENFSCHLKISQIFKYHSMYQIRT